MTFSNDKNVYLLGAGFSKELGLPLQDDFLLVAKEVFFKNPHLFRHFENVFEYQDRMTKMKKYLNYPLLNLEHLFNLIEMDIFYSKHIKVRKIKNDFIRLICDVLKDKTIYPFKRDRSGHLTEHTIYNNYFNFIRLFVKDGNDNELKIYDDTIISFNYDLVVENAAWIYNWRRENLLDSKYRGSFTRKIPTFFKLNMLIDNINIMCGNISNYINDVDKISNFIQSDIFSNDNNSIKFIKLHGSINWETRNKKGIKERFIVPPTWNKSDPRVKTLWDKAYRELIQARRIIIIGYSFPETDIYVKSLLTLALNENKILQNIYFINPDKEVVKKASLGMLDSYFEKHCLYQEWNFSDFINSRDGIDFIKDKLNRKI